MGEAIRVAIREAIGEQKGGGTVREAIRVAIREASKAMRTSSRKP
jgi:hypothetical protein